MRNKTKILVTAVAMVLVLSAMVVGVWAASTQNQGFTAKVSFTATDVTFEVVGQVFGTTLATQPSWTRQTISANASTVASGGTPLTWNVNSGNALIPASTTGTGVNPNIRFCFAIKSLVTDPSAVKAYIIPTMVATPVSNMAVTYKFLKTTMAGTAGQAPSGIVLANNSIVSNSAWQTAATDATITMNAANPKKCIRSSSTFGLHDTSGSGNGLGVTRSGSSVSNYVYTYDVAYFEIIYTVIDTTVNVVATAISFNLMVCSSSKVSDYSVAS